MLQTQSAQHTHKKEKEKHKKNILRIILTEGVWRTHMATDGIVINI